MIQTRCIITSASDKFFPSLLNFLGSIDKNYPNHPDVYVYDLGLFSTFKKELESIPWVHLMEMPHFVPHWRSCYTWKTYALNTPLSELNLYLDAGCQVLQSLDPLFEKINTQGYLAVSQGPAVRIKDITPADYVERFFLPKDKLDSEIIAAGLFGFKKDPAIKAVTEKLYQAGINKDCLGFSQAELWKNKGLNKTEFVRDCKMFRHDTTMLSIFLYANIPDLIVEPAEHFSNVKENSPTQYLWSFRMNYKNLEYLHEIHKSLWSKINRVYVHLFIFLKSISNTIKK